MEINDNDYARLLQWVEQARRHIVALEQENRELRRQVDDLRRGVGMAIVVQGRVIPVNPAPAEVPQPNAGPTPHPSFGPAFQASQQQSQPASRQPSPLPQPQRAMPQAQPISRPEVFSEELWITGQMRAVKAPTSAPAQRSIRSIRPVTPSQEMTPSWLREDTPPTPERAHASSSTPPPTPAPPSAPRRTLAAATGSHPAIPKPRSQPQEPRSMPPNLQQTGRQRVSARPLSRVSAPLPSLADLTGQRPAVHVPGRQRQDPDERSPYSDSFVLD